MAKWKNDEVPWERWSNESEPAFEAFKTYRDMDGRRSIGAVAKQLSKSRQLMSRWKSAYEWDERCIAYDNELEKDKLKQEKKDRESMRKRQAQVATALRLKALEGMATIKAEDMTPKDIARFLELSYAMEKSAMQDQSSDRLLELEREKFEYQKERDAGENIEYEDLDEVEEEIYGEKED